jgi:hypothetical protein
MKIMKSTQQGKGFIPILILVVGAAVLGLLFLNKDNFTSSAPSNIAPSSDTKQVQNAAPQGTVEMMLDPATKATMVNQSFSLMVNVDPKTESVSAVDLKLSYDPAYLEATSIKEGTPLPVVLSAGKVSGNMATIVVGANISKPLNSTGTVATVTFKAKKAGVTKVMVDKMTQVAAIGKKTNMLGKTTDAEVTIK